LRETAVATTAWSRRIADDANSRARPSQRTAACAAVAQGNI
jgi:hypothetical protein